MCYICESKVSLRSLLEFMENSISIQRAFKEHSMSVHSSVHSYTVGAEKTSFCSLCDHTDLHQGGCPLSLQGGNQPGCLVTLEDASVRHEEIFFSLNDISEDDDVLNDKSHDRNQGNDDHHRGVKRLTSPGITLDIGNKRASCQDNYDRR